jgi:hypothetical protein
MLEIQRDRALISVERREELRKPPGGIATFGALDQDYFGTEVRQ